MDHCFLWVISAGFIGALSNELSLKVSLKFPDHNLEPKNIQHKVNVYRCIQIQDTLNPRQLSEIPSTYKSTKIKSSIDLAVLVTIFISRMSVLLYLCVASYMHVY